MTYYVYHLIDPRCDNVFYVGKGVGGRVKEHERDAKRGLAGAKCDRIREIWACGQQVVRRIVKEFADERAAYAFEKREIDRIVLDRLCNAMRGAVPDLSHRNRVPEGAKTSPEYAAAKLCEIFGRALLMLVGGRKLSIWQRALVDALGRSILTIEAKFGRPFVDAELQKVGVRVDGRLFPEPQS